MGSLNPAPVEIVFGNKTYRCFFTLNCLDEVQEHFDKALSEIIDVILDQRHSARNIRYILTLLLNESMDSEGDFTEEDIGKAIEYRNFDYYFGKVIETLGASLPDESEEDSDPNPTGGQ